ncbi:flavodoxin [Caldimonas aquatica]|uniref:Flavodoxin n=1 Tax=Caldimonas aquatica TaxID=376175 RepID=A0ABY6MPQ9_9BURK|nr:flavodoxin [Schlegelella aquatica]UZD53607.1 flavodoxin [Schlegelella aquatica]
MGKVLVVSYSYTGTSRQVATTLAGLQGWATGEISEERPGRGDGRCVLDSLLRRQPPIRYEGPPPEQFAAVVLVAPIWLYRLAGPMRTFVARYRERLPAVAVVSAMGGRGAPNAVAEIGRLLGRSPILSTAFLSREVEDGSYGSRLRAFGEAVDKAVEGTEVLRPSTLSPKTA